MNDPTPFKVRFEYDRYPDPVVADITVSDGEEFLNELRAFALEEELIEKRSKDLTLLNKVLGWFVSHIQKGTTNGNGNTSAK